MNRRAVVLGLAAGAVAPAWADSVRPRVWTRTTALLSGYVDAGKLAGACAAIRLRGGAPQYIAKGAQTLGGAGADERTIWRVFSMSKPVTGIAAMTLVERGKLGLDQPVADVAPEFANLQVLDNGATRPARTVMRMRHLLTHTAGLGYAINPGSPIAALYRNALILPGDPTPRAGAPQSLEEFGARLAALPLGSDPGTRYEYSVGLDLMGLIVQRVSGMPFEDYLRTVLFEPLGMTDTGFVAAGDAKARLAQNYRVAPGGIEPLEPPDRSPYTHAPAYPSGGGGLLSTARDYSRFCAMLTGGGMLDGVRVLSRATARRAHADMLPRGVRADGGMKFGAGMGIATATSRTPGGEPSGSYFWGGAAGTQMWMDPVHDMSVVMMTQFMPSDAYPLRNEIRRAIYEDLAHA